MDQDRSNSRIFSPLRGRISNIARGRGKIRPPDDIYAQRIDEGLVSDPNHDSDECHEAQSVPTNGMTGKTETACSTEFIQGQSTPAKYIPKDSQSESIVDTRTHCTPSEIQILTELETDVRSSTPIKLLPGQSDEPKPTDLRLESIEDDDAETLRQKLREAITRLQEAEAGNRLRLIPPEDLAYGFKTFHFIDPYDEDSQNTKVFLEEPQWVPAEGDRVELIARSPIRGVDYYLYQHPEVAFVFYKDYVSTPLKDISKIESKDGVLKKAEPYETTLVLSADSMKEAFKEFLRLLPDSDLWFPEFDVEVGIWAPDRFAYHSRQHVRSICDALTPLHAKLIKLLMDAINQDYGQQYLQTDTQALKGVVTKETLLYLIKPGDILVKLDGLNTRAYKAMSWPGYCRSIETTSKEEQQTHGQTDSSREPRKQTRNQANLAKKITHQFPMSVSTYEFDGSFELQFYSAAIEFKVTHEDDEVRIDSLNLVPLRFVSEEVREMLPRRGKMFWECRRRLLVTHHYESDSHISNTNDRFMVDMITCRKLFASHFSEPPLRDDMGDRMDIDEPPGDEKVMLFPPTITGFNLRTKSHRTLFIEKMRHVIWHNEAFDHLVVPDSTKILVEALVTNQLGSEKNTDLISGKGGGLILLLHGAPGTGKTFTAEGVAEAAKKPLLRVTCGDVGIEPHQVEEQLLCWFGLGEIWDCVVLLDEADVFLEERDIKDLKRNALVSVFLRVIEYYKGILILTSNRVGTFDEAFKSRIQLALHYQNLDESQRCKIWSNFITRLETIDGGSDIDSADVKYHVRELGRQEMNGREIRNVITTARQLAKHKKEKMAYRHLKDAINANAMFGKYLTDLREGTDDDLKREGGIR